MYGLYNTQITSLSSITLTPCNNSPPYSNEQTPELEFVLSHTGATKSDAANSRTICQYTRKADCQTGKSFKE